MVNNFRRNNAADKLYTFDIIFNPDKLKKEIKPYVDKADFSKNENFIELFNLLVSVFIFCS